MHNDKELLCSRNCFKLIHTFTVTAIIVGTTEEKHKKPSACCRNKNCCEVTWLSGGLAVKLWLPSKNLCFGAAGPHSAQQVQAVLRFVTLRYVTFSAYRSVGRSVGRLNWSQKRHNTTVWTDSRQWSRTRVATFNPTCVSRLLATQGLLVLSPLIASDVNGTWRPRRMMNGTNFCRQ
jgi:hypothetical protein